MRYPDCQMGERSDCSACSLSSYGRDCRNNPANPIAYLRTQHGMTQRQLADAAGMNIRQVQKLESGETLVENTTVKNALAIAAALGVSDLRELL